MALRVSLHYFNQSDNIFYMGVQDYTYSHSAATLTLTPAPAVSGTSQSNFGNSPLVVDMKPVLRVEINPSPSTFPGNATNTPSG